MQSMGTPPDKYESIMQLARLITERYAAACGADYQLFVGHKDPGLHPSWNRIPLILEAFAAGYRKVVWLDCDTLVVDLDQSIFAATDETTPLYFNRIAKEGEWVVKNDGVIVANNTPGAVAALNFVWSHRYEPNYGHEQGWLDDYVLEHPDVVTALDPRFNWWDWEGGITKTIDPTYPPQDAAVILAWHAMPGAITRQHKAYHERWSSK